MLTYDNFVKFLSLSVFQSPLDLVALWKRFCAVDSAFVEKYVVYHHLRSKGWVPKAGLKYGVNFGE